MILNSQPIVIFLGKSGAGKDTQMELLREKMGFDFINSGDSFNCLFSNRSDGIFIIFPFHQIFV